MRAGTLFRGARAPSTPQCTSNLHVRCQAQASGQAQAGTQSASRPQPQQPQVLALLEETRDIAWATGPRGLLRGIGAAQACAEVMRDAVGDPSILQQPQVVLRRLFEKLGATYIKLGQFIASSPTLFPAEYVLEFSRCLDNTEPTPWPTIRKTLQEELGRPIEEVFSSVDPVPLASASVAQVHTAVLRESGKEVVVKVLKPGVEDTLTVDLNFVYLASRYLEVLNPALSRTSLAAIVGDVRATMMEEVDFTKEAMNIKTFSTFLDNAGLREVATCPYVYTMFSGRRLLTLEKLEGVALTDLDAIKRTTRADPEQTLINALNVWTASVLGCESFHADVHAGNLMVLTDGRVGFIDFGIVGRISPVTWTALQALVAAVAVADYPTMAKALATMGATDEAVDIDLFARDLQKLMLEFEELDSELVVSASGETRGVAAQVVVDDTALNQMLLELVRVGETHGVKFPREFGLLVKQVLYFDRYVKILAPSLSVVDDPRVQLSMGERYGRLRRDADL